MAEETRLKDEAWKEERRKLELQRMEEEIECVWCHGPMTKGLVGLVSFSFIPVPRSDAMVYWTLLSSRSHNSLSLWLRVALCRMCFSIFQMQEHKIKHDKQK